jgi:spore coat polysaccharide biosynthesis protein SpsF
MEPAMRIVGIIQARMSSRRLPNKVLLPLAGEPVLAHVVKRTRACPLIDEVWVATSTEASDNPIEDWARGFGVRCARGSLNDVLDRYVQTARVAKADAVVRITADCPALDPQVLTEVLEEFSSGPYDLYGLSGEFPDGLDCSVFSIKALERAWAEAKLPSEREHVGPYIEKHPELFRLGGLNKFDGMQMGHHRWTLDEPEDYELLTKIFDSFAPGAIFRAEDILDLLRINPDWLKINKKIGRNEGYARSLQEDKAISHV